MAGSFPLLKKTKRLCVVCKSDKTSLLFRQTFSKFSDDSSLLSGYDVVTCSKCGFCFADNIPVQSIFDAYYRDMSKYEKAGQGGQDTIYDQARFQSMANVILGLLTSPQTRIFEVGCANGQVLALLKENVSGIDPSPVSAEIARKKYDIQVSANTLSDLPSNTEPVDFLILAGVLEHVRDINPALSRLRQLLSADGQLFISVPDASRYTEGEDAPFQEFSVEHINFFGPVSLENLLTADGFSKIVIKQDMVESNHRTRTPVIHGLFKKSDSPGPISYPHDDQTEASLKNYIDQSTQAHRFIQTSINKIVDAGRSIVVWGTGSHTLRLLETSRLGNARIRAFVDSNPRYQGKSLNNIPIIAPGKLKELAEPILISSRVYQEEIAQQIRISLNLKNEIIRLY
jgi:SAM-dependent methyltransferase